jgi:hypothetical protein
MYKGGSVETCLSVITRHLYGPVMESGACSSVVVKALCYKPEGRGIASR